MCSKLMPSKEDVEEKDKAGKSLLSHTNRSLNALKAVYQELGAWTFRVALKEAYEEIRGVIARSHTPHSELFSSWLDSLFVSLQELTEARIGCADQEDAPVETVLANSSPKLRCLLDIFKSCGEKEIGSKDFHAIVFVQRIAIAQHLCALFKRLAQFEDYQHLKCGYLVGNTTISTATEEPARECDFAKQVSA